MADVNLNDKSNTDFEEFRRKIHPEEEKGRTVVPSPHKGIAMAFGIFMIIVYVGVGVLFLINFFNWDSSFTWARYMLGVLFILYGIYRGYREFSHTGYYSR